MTDRRLLVVEDNELIRGKLETFFLGKGFAVQTASDLTSALGHLGSVKFEAVITEFLLPGGTCEALAKQIRNKGLKGQTALVVLVSSKQSLDSVEDARRIFDAVLLKPFKALELFKTVSDLVNAQAPSGAPSTEAEPFSVEIEQPADGPGGAFALDANPARDLGARESRPSSPRPFDMGSLLQPLEPAAPEPSADIDPIPLEFDLGRPSFQDAPAPDAFGGALEIEIEPPSSADLPAPAPDDSALDVSLDAPIELAPREADASDPLAAFDAPIDIDAPVDLDAPLNFDVPIDLNAPVELGEPIELGAPLEFEIDLASPAPPEPEPPRVAPAESLPAPTDELEIEIGTAADEPPRPPAAPREIAAPDVVGRLAALPDGAQPLLAGDLAESPFAQILLEIFHRGTTGVLVLSVESAEKRIYFVNGIPVYAESTILSENLGQFLLAAGVISEPDYQRALERMQRDALQQGEAFVRLGLFSYAELLQHLQRQIREKVLTTFAWPAASVQLFEDAHFVDSKLIFEMHPVLLIHEGIGRYLSEDALAAEFANYVASRVFVRRTDQLQRILSPIISLMPSIDVDACFSGERRIEDLRTLTGLSDAALGQLLRTLLVVGAVELVEAASQVTIDEGARDDHSVIGESLEVDEDQIVDTQSVKPAPTAPTARADEAVADANAMIDRVTRDYLRTKTNDYYKVLGVPHDSSVRAVEEAYLALADAYHPDKFRDVEILGIRSKAKEVFLRVSTAYGILSDVASRRAYDQGLTSRAGDVATKDKTIGAQLEFQSGERALESGDFAAAAAAFERALALNEKEPVYHLYLGWTEWNLSGDDAARRERAKAFLNRGIAMNPIIDIGYVFLGRVLKAESKLSEAREMFERALVFNPDNADAAREANAIQATAL